MALTYEQCCSCGRRTQIDTMVPPEERRCLSCGGPCSAAEAPDAMEVPSADGVPGTDPAYVPAQLITMNCPHCTAVTAFDPGKPRESQSCHACGWRLEDERGQSRNRTGSLVTPDGLLPERSRETAGIPIAGIVLALVLAATFTVWMMQRPETKAAPPAEILPPDDRTAINTLVTAFTAARTPEELLPLIREPETFEKSVRAWCAAQADRLPMGGKLIGDIGNPRTAFGATLRQAKVAWRNRPPGFLLVVATPAGWRVDWRAFEGLGELSVENFAAQKPETPALVLAVVRRSDYYNGPYIDKRAWECLHVTDSTGHHSVYAYVPRTSAALLKALEVLPPGGREGDLDPAAASRRLALRMVFRSRESATLRLAEVTAVEGDGWYLP